MVQKQLYTSETAYLTEQPGENCTISLFVRLIADDGKAITDGETVTVCVDVPKENVPLWMDCEMPPEEPEPMTETEQKARAFDILMGVTE